MVPGQLAAERSAVHGEATEATCDELEDALGDVQSQAVWMRRLVMVDAHRVAPLREGSLSRNLV
ncbi:hypothetical protein GCM10010149_91810 [Nonomuraea roseoviolacea subsp. roseoviolacea]